MRTRTLVALATIFTAVSCAGAKASPPSPTIRMAHNDWLSATLNDEVARILLVEQLGMSVELVPAETSAQFDAIRAGDLHVSLEVWPSGHPDQIAQFVQKDETVEDIGLLGPTARVGWFVPTYLLTAHPELASWQGLQSPSAVSLFATSDTQPRGRFVNGDPKWVQWDQKILDNLSLNYEVVFLGSEDAVLTALDDAYSKRLPILFYLWEPHWVFAEKDLTLVELPAYAPECWAAQKCAYPPDPLFKIAWPGLKDLSPEAYAFFKAFHYSAQDQVQMMNAVHGGASVAQAARAWVDTHRAVWAPWIDAASQ